MAVNDLHTRLGELQAELAQIQIFKKLADNSPQAIAIVAPGGLVTYANRAYGDLTGYGAEAVGMNNAQHQPPEVQTELLPQIMAGAMSGGWQGELPFLRRDGTLVQTQAAVVALFDETNQPLAVAVIAQDITRAKWAEKYQRHLSAIVESSGDLISLTDMQRQVIYINPAGFTMVGRKKEDCPDAKVSDFYPPDMLQLVSETCLPVVRERGFWMGELQLQHVDGHRVPVDAMIMLVRDEAGEPLGYGTIYRDITERKQAEAEREQLHQQVIEAQSQALKELSTPIIPILDRIIVMPLIGSIDTVRARDIMRSLLAGITQHNAQVAILDITGVPVVDSGVAGHLNRTIQAARLKGANTIVTGVSDAVAETIVDLGIDWSGIETASDLQTGLRLALNRSQR